MSTDSTDDLQFATPEPINPAVAAPAAPVQTCAGCRRPITSTYFALRDKVICPDCVAQVNAPPAGSAAIRVLKAGLMGLGAGLVGAIIWFAIRRLAHVEVGLVAVLVGFMVGKSVRKGSGGRGGLGYQIMAVLLTYCCIAANYMPDAVEAAINHSRDIANPQIILGEYILCLKLPFLIGARNILGIVIICFALLQAWKFNKPRSLAITGPYQVGVIV